jgi:hypothetical protein
MGSRDRIPPPFFKRTKNAKYFSSFLKKEVARGGAFFTTLPLSHSGSPHISVLVVSLEECYAGPILSFM